MCFSVSVKWRIYQIFYPFPLVAEAECADSPGRFASSTALHLLVDCTKARLAVLSPVSDHKHVGQVSDIAGRQAQRLDFGEFSVHRFRGDECPKRREGRVDVLGSVSLPSVGGVPLPHHAAGLLSVTLPRSPAAAVALVGAAVALAAVPLLVVRHQGQVSGVREGMRRHRPQHCERSHHMWFTGGGKPIPYLQVENSCVQPTAVRKSRRNSNVQPAEVSRLF